LKVAGAFGRNCDSGINRGLAQTAQDSVARRAGWIDLGQQHQIVARSTRQPVNREGYLGSTGVQKYEYSHATLHCCVHTRYDLHTNISVILTHLPRTASCTRTPRNPHTATRTPRLAPRNSQFATPHPLRPGSSSPGPPLQTISAPQREQRYSPSESTPHPVRTTHRHAPRRRDRP
jgi:hypothetical protein